MRSCVHKPKDAAEREDMKTWAMVFSFRREVTYTAHTTLSASACILQTPLYCSPQPVTACRQRYIVLCSFVISSEFLSSPAWLHHCVYYPLSVLLVWLQATAWPLFGGWSLKITRPLTRSFPAVIELLSSFVYSDGAIGCTLFCCCRFRDCADLVLLHKLQTIVK